MRHYWICVLVCPQCRSIYNVAFRKCGLDGSKLIETIDDPLIGSSIAQYAIKGRLGAGNYGSVYRASHLELPDKHFAVKVLFGEFAAQPKASRRFHREAKAMSRMEHPNIVPVVDFGVTEGGLTFLVKDLIRGQTLADLIRLSAPLPDARVAVIARDIAAGLSHAHSRGYIHRDLKPANIMMRDDGPAMMLDFGVVGIVASDRHKTDSITSTGYTLGTPHYMAPEQTAKSKVGPQADLYALGVVTYEMLTGRLPLDGRAATVIIKKRTTAPPPPPGSGELGRVAHRLMQVNPEDRPRNASDVAAMLHVLLGRADSVPSPSGR